MAYQRKPKQPKTCDYCGVGFMTAHLQKRYCTSQHRQKHRWEREHLGGLEISDKVQCLDCGRWFVKLGTHVVQSHGYLSARDYRIAHGLDYKRGIVPESHRALLKQNVEDNGTIDNLQKGAAHRFKKGDGRASGIVKSYFKYKRTGVYEENDSEGSID